VHPASNRELANAVKTGNEEMRGTLMKSERSVRAKRHLHLVVGDLTDDALDTEGWAKQASGEAASDVGHAGPGLTEPLDDAGAWCECRKSHPSTPCCQLVLVDQSSEVLRPP
jgi:hypothetical protein